MSEGECLSEYLEGLEIVREEKSPLLSNLMPNAKYIYLTNRGAKVGALLLCPTCGRRFIKRSYQNVFCGTRGKGGKKNKGVLCKDTYHNSISEKRRERAKCFKG